MLELLMIGTPKTKNTIDVVQLSVARVLYLQQPHDTVNLCAAKVLYLVPDVASASLTIAEGV